MSKRKKEKAKEKKLRRSERGEVGVNSTGTGGPSASSASASDVVIAERGQYAAVLMPEADGASASLLHDGRALGVLSFFPASPSPLLSPQPLPSCRPSSPGCNGDGRGVNVRGAFEASERSPAHLSLTAFVNKRRHLSLTVDTAGGLYVIVADGESRILQRLQLVVNADGLIAGLDELKIEDRS